MKKGFTLVEIIVSVAIFTVIFLAVMNFGQGIFSFNRKAQQNLSAQSDARRVLKTIIKELRSASPSSNGAYPIAQTATSSLIFFSNIDEDADKERIRYFLDGTDLKKGVVNPSGTPLVYNLANESISVVIKNVRNGVTPIFEYFDSSFSGTGNSLLEPVQATVVRLIRITTKIEEDPNKPIGELIVTSQAFLRNLKDNL